MAANMSGIGIGLGIDMTTFFISQDDLIIPWLLDGGVWNDDGIWVDSETWQDS